MKKTVRNTLFAAIAFTFIITVLSAVLGFIAMTTDYDASLGYFAIGSVPAAISLYLPLSVPVVVAIVAVFIRKEFSIGMPERGISSLFTSVLTGLLMISSGVFSWINGTAFSKLAAGIIIFAILGGVVFAASGFIKDKIISNLLMVVPAIWAALHLVEEYFREGLPINSPLRTASLAMFAFLLLFFTEELRFGINRQLTGAYYFCILSAIAFTGSTAIPRFFIILAGKNNMFGFDLISCCLYVALFFFLVVRLVSLPSAFKPYEAPAKLKKKTAPASNAYIDSKSTGADVDSSATDISETNEDNK